MKTFFTIIAVILAGLGIAIGVVSLVGPKRKHTELTQRNAYSLACDRVQQSLKSPATAVFPDIKASRFAADEKHLMISSYVDSQNSFGALIRSDWSVVLENDGVRYTTAEIRTFKTR